LLIIATTACVFAFVGIELALRKPFHALSASSRNTTDSAFKNISDRVKIPIPPYTHQVFTTSSANGEVTRYTSDLSPKGIMTFYINEMPEHNWKRDLAFEEGQASRIGHVDALSFTTGGERCIMFLSRDGPLRTSITLLRSEEHISERKQ
jgi:hypothetical protein